MQPIREWIAVSLFFFSFHFESVPTRDVDGNSYSRHINLQLTYSFQNAAHNSPLINNNSNLLTNNNNNSSNDNSNHNNNSKPSLYTAHGKYWFSCACMQSPHLRQFLKFSLSTNSDSALDDLSQDSSIRCIQQAEVCNQWLFRYLSTMFHLANDGLSKVRFTVDRTDRESQPKIEKLRKF